MILYFVTLIAIAFVPVQVCDNEVLRLQSEDEVTFMKQEAKLGGLYKYFHSAGML